MEHTEHTSNGEFNSNEAINEAIENALKNNKKFHIFGLCSDGGVHSHTSHIIAIAKLAYSKSHFQWAEKKQKLPTPP